MADKKPKVRLFLRGYEPVVESGTKRRFRNIETGETISRREFAKRAVRVEQPPTRPKERETAKEHRLKLYQNFVNRQIWMEGGQPWEYQSKAELERSAEFKFYNDMVGSGYASDREYASDFWEELEDIYADQDWGETPD